MEWAALIWPGDFQEVGRMEVPGSGKASSTLVPLDLLIQELIQGPLDGVAGVGAGWVLGPFPAVLP